MRGSVTVSRYGYPNHAVYESRRVGEPHVMFVCGYRRKSRAMSRRQKEWPKVFLTVGRYHSVPNCRRGRQAIRAALNASRPPLTPRWEAPGWSFLPRELWVAIRETELCFTRSGDMSIVKNLKLLIRLLIVLLVGALILPFFVNGPKGRPLMTTSRVKRNIRHTIEDIKASYNKAMIFFSKMVKSSNNTVGSAQSILPSKNSLPGKIYKWKDKNGNWHYSDKPRKESANPKTK